MPKLDASDKEVLGRTLREGLKQSGEAQFFHRLNCVLLVAQGFSCSEVADWFGHDPSTVARWVRHYRAFHAEGLRNDRKSGRPAQLSFGQLKALERDVGRAPAELGYGGFHWNGKLLAAHLENRCAVTLSVRQCQRLLRQLHDHIEAHRAETSVTTGCKNSVPRKSSSAS